MVKRVLHKILPEVLDRGNRERKTGNIRDSSLTYPDLSSEVAGWLKQAEAAGDEETMRYYQTACREIGDRFKWAKEATDSKNQNSCGIPWIDQNYSNLPHPRLINSGWLIEDFPFQDKNEKQTELTKMRTAIANYFPTGKKPPTGTLLLRGMETA